jgi:hypothetical protein
MPLLQRKWPVMDNHRSLTFGSQAGQSLVETAIVGAFVLVPLFIITPLLGKYINMQDSTLLAARNAAFERTVWSRHGQRNGEAVAQESNSAIEEKTWCVSLGSRIPHCPVRPSVPGNIRHVCFGPIRRGNLCCRNTLILQSP